MSHLANANVAHIPKAIMLATIGALFLSLMAFCAKLVSTHMPTAEITFFRFTISALYILAMLCIKHLRGSHVSLKTQHIGMHIMRALASTGAMYSLYYALHYIPLVDANLLTLTYPLFALILTVLIFKAKVKILSWVAMGVGFIGIILVLKPTPELFTPASAIGLFSGICAAVGILGVRELSKYEHAYTIMFYYTLFALLISCLFVFFDWQMPDKITLLTLVGVGVFGTLYQEFLTRALAYAPAYIPSSIMYFSVVCSSIFGMVVWNHFPDLWSWLGIALVCTGNIFVIRGGARGHAT